MKPLFDFTPPDKLTQQEAEQLFVPFATKFTAVFEDSWDEWIDLGDQFRGKLDPTARANVVQNLARYRARELFADVATVRPCNDLGFFKMYIGSPPVAVVRLKHLGAETHLARNIQTDQQKQWYSHEPLEGVRGDCTRLNVGYTLNLTQHEIRDVLVSLQIGEDHLVYSFSLKPKHPTQDQPAIPLRPIEPDTKPTIRPKGAPPKGGKS